jgi:hypothetical protein
MEPTRNRCLSKSFPEERTLGLVHTEMDSENFLGTPFLHRRAGDDAADCNFVFPLLLEFDRSVHLSCGDPVNSFNATGDRLYSGLSFQMLGGMIRLAGPSLFNKLDPATIHYDIVAVTDRYHDKSGPSRMRFESKRGFQDVAMIIDHCPPHNHPSYSERAFRNAAPFPNSSTIDDKRS